MLALDVGRMLNGLSYFLKRNQQTDAKPQTT